MQEVAWERMKAQELRALAEQNAVVILPVASIEQHGPHLPVMVDTRLGQEIALRAARKAYDTRPTVVAPVMWAGLSEHHMPFGGTLTLSQTTFMAVLNDLVNAITRHGFRDILISNSHGGNNIACQHFINEAAPKGAATLAFTCYPQEAAEEYAAILEDQSGMSHACEAETSMMMAVEPDLVDTSDLASLAKGQNEGGKFTQVGTASYRWRPYTHMTSTGLTGNPTRASAAKGEALCEAGAQKLADLICDPETWAMPGDMRGVETGGVPFRKGS